MNSPSISCGMQPGAIVHPWINAFRPRMPHPQRRSPGQPNGFDDIQTWDVGAALLQDLSTGAQVTHVVWYLNLPRLDTCTVAQAMFALSCKAC